MRTEEQIEDVYALSPMQAGMLFHTLYEGEPGAYLDQQVYAISGDLDVAAFERAWTYLIERHSVLRTSFHWEELEEPLQVVHMRADLPLDCRDWSGLSEGEQHDRRESLLKEHRTQGVDLSEAPLMRLTLVRTGLDSWQLFWTRHHLILDRWSGSLMLDELSVAYEALRQGRRVEIPQLRPYGDYIGWLQEQDPEAAEVYWRRALAGFTAPTVLSVDRAPGSLPGQSKSARQQERLSEEASSALQALARQHRLTLNTLVQGAWALLLSRYSGQDDVLFGATVSGRPASLSGVESMVGLFINSVPVRVRVPASASLLDWLQELQNEVSEMREYEYSSLVQIQTWSEMPRGVPLFDTLVGVQNTPANHAVKEPGEHEESGGSLQMRSVGSESSVNFPLILLVLPGRSLSLSLSYEMGRFDGADMVRLLGHLKTLLEGIAADPYRQMSSLPMLTEAERRQLLVEWNTTSAEYPRNRGAHELFEEQVEHTRDAVAVVFEDQSLTYDELNRRANQLAHTLRDLGVGPEVLVGLCIDRSLEMAVAILGTLKAGGAYVPLDPSYPLERLAYMLEDAQPAVLLSRETCVDVLPSYGLPVLCLDADWPLISTASEANPVSEATADNAAYVIYTSGTTGRPKGAVIRHGGLTNYLTWCSQSYNVAAGSGSPVHSSLSFDLTITSLLPTLLVGRTVWLLPETDGVEGLTQFLRASRDLSLVKITPAHLDLLSRELAPEEACGRTRAFIVGGEALLTDQIEFWRRNAPETRIINEYGPTETVVGCCVYECGPDSSELDSSVSSSVGVPIGRPIANTRLYVLDARMAPAPVGVYGELFIGGDGLARGYLNRADLTAEKFVPDPFCIEPGERLYRTGDLVRYLPDGNLEFLGRIDLQVKIRGFRIELGEIESVLAQVPDVREAVVLAREDMPGDRRLVAYLVEQDGPVNPADLKKRLRDRLPEYMVPSAFVVIEALPLSPNGKVDRKALPAPEGAVAGETYAPPRSPIEEALAEIWREVLRVEQVGIHDSFFDLGGHSLLGTQVISRIRSVLQLDLPLRAIFDAPSVAGLAEQIAAAQHVEVTLAPPLVRASREGRLPLSFSQQRLWFLNQYEPESTVYNVPSALRLIGALNVEALQRTLEEIVRRHEALRTTFTLVDTDPVQVIHEPFLLPLAQFDLAALSEDERDARARQLLQEEGWRPFDLEHGPVFRAALLRLGEQDHILLLTMHHIVSDAWSQGVLRRELAALYTAYQADLPSPLPDLPIQYADYAAWQRAWLQGEPLDGQIGYWKQRLAGAPTLLELPTDRPRPAVRTFRGAHIHTELSAELTEGLKALGRQEGATLFMTLLAAFQALLARYSGQDDIVVGTPIANRTRAECEGLIGFFLNTLALRADLSDDPSFRELLGRVREAALGGYAHQDLPFERLVEEVSSERSLSHSPLFQVMFTMQNAPGAALTLGGLQIGTLRTESVTSKFDVSLGIAPIGNGLLLGLEYNTDLFDADRMERMLGHYRTLLEGIVADAEQRISALPLITAPERQQLIVDWNETRLPFLDRRLHQLVEAQVELTPEAPALWFEGASLTYRELDARANRLAHHLRTLGICAGSIVGVVLERSFDLVVGLLGTLKAGAAYLPIDPDYPAERVAYMLRNSAVPVVLSQESLVERLPENGARLLCLDRDWSEIAAQPADRPHLVVDAEDPAYVIYTSGSTGRPKGVVVPHRAIVNHMQWMAHAFPLTAQDRSPLKTPISFDASIWECWGPLMAGGELVIARPGGHTDAAYLVDLIQQREITTIKLVPSLLQMLLEEERFAECRSLRQVFCGAEALSRDLQDRFFARFGGRVSLHDLYGPTEAAIDATGFTCHPGWQRAWVPIGRPISNVRAYVLDRRLNPAPIGVHGELYLGGANLATGYLNAADLTAERFVPDPFSQTGGERLYRTGDLVRTLPDGNIEFVGRMDHQVKVRGFRIELGEIESVLQQQPSVREAVVLAREDRPGDRRLVAYLVGQAEAVSVNALREQMGQLLPVYMVPSAFVLLDALPLSPSGKVDRKALPAPEAVAETGEEDGIAPRTPFEEGIAQIWGEVLGLEGVGVHDNFFELGGHSLLATQVISRIRNNFQVDIALRALFETPTVAGLAQHVQALQRAGEGLIVPPLKPAPRDVDLPLSFSQQRLWFIDQLEPGSSLYNVPSVLRLRGRLDLDALQRSLQEITTRHEVLRTRYAVKGGQPVQSVCEASVFPLPLLDLSDLPAAEREEEAMRRCREEAARPFDLGADPMMRATLLRLEEAEHLLLLTLHHIASDGWSGGLLMRELSRLYNAFAAGEPSPLSALAIQYADYAAWQRGWLQGEALDRQVSYWASQLSGAPPVLELPTDRPRESATSYSGGMHRFVMGAELTQGLHRLCLECRATPFMVLLAAFDVLLYRWTGQSDLVVGTDVANRTQPQTEEMIGFFLNHLVLRTQLSGDPSFGEVVGQVREVCLGAYAHQDLPFDKLVEVIQPERRLSHTPVFQVLFVVQNVPRGGQPLSGLEMSSVGSVNGTSKFDLSLFIGEGREGLGGAWVYRADLFERSSVRRLCGEYLGVLGQVLRNPRMAIEDVELIGWSEERSEVPTEPEATVVSAARLRGAARRTAIVVDAE